jgi:hypothetical protein
MSTASLPNAWQTLETLAAAAYNENASLVIVDPVTRDTVLGVVRNAEVPLRSDSRCHAGLAAWTAANP